MSSLLYLLLRFARSDDSFPYDTQVLCLLLAIEGPGYLNALRLWVLSFKDR